MLRRIIELSVKNKLVIILFTGAAIFGGIWAIQRTPLEALPDLSDVQVIVQTEYNEQAPRIVEDQVTYPISAEMLKVPGSRIVRGYSFFGVSFVYVIFDDGTDLYWARSRVLEYLNAAAGRLPNGVTPSLGPDATGVGWVYQYVVRGAQKSLAELRTVQDWYLRYGLAKAEGVSEVASVGGFVKQYSVVIDPRRLQSLGIALSSIRNALRSSNIDVGGRTVELAETEFVVRGRGYIKSLGDLEQIVVKNDRGVPVLRPFGPHAIYIDGRACCPHLPDEQLPAWSLSVALYLHAGIRAWETGNVMQGRWDEEAGTWQWPALDLMRLAVPRRVYSGSHLAYAAEAMIEVYQRRHEVRGLRFVYRPPALAQFVATFEPV